MIPRQQQLDAAERERDRETLLQILQMFTEKK